MNLHYTQYPVVKVVARKLKYLVRNDDLNMLALFGMDAREESIAVEDFDVCWIDCGVPPEALAKIKPYQRISQFPGIQAISNKNKLARNLMKMRKYFTNEYNFFPQTYLLPVEHNELRRQIYMNNKRDFYIIKPEALT